MKSWWYCSVMVGLAILLSGCPHVRVDGDTKVSTPPFWLLVVMVGGSVVGAVLCWIFRKKWPATWLGIVGLPLLAIFCLVGYSQGRSVVSPEHFEERTMFGGYSVRFEELSKIQIVEERTGIYRGMTEVVNYYVDLHKKDGGTQRIKLNDPMRALWWDIVVNAQKHGVVYEDNYGYLANPR